PVAGVEIGGEQRPVLFRSETFLGGSGEGTVPASRELEVPLIAPARWRAPGHLSLKALIGVGKRHRFAAPDLRTGGAPTVRLAFEPDEVGEPFQYSLLGAWLPKQGANVRRLGPVYVPHASRLRLGMGFEEKPCKEQPITDFA